MNKKNALGTAALAMALAPAAWAEIRMDRTASLPAEVAQGARDARGDWLAYREANAQVDKAAHFLALGLPGVGKEDRDAEKAKAYNMLLGNLQRVKLHLKGFATNMEQVLGKLHETVGGDLGAAGGDITEVLGDFNAASVEQDKTISNLVTVAEMGRDELDETQQRKLNGLIQNFKFRERIQGSLARSQARIGRMQESMESKLAGMDAAVAAVNVRLKEVEAEISLAKVMRGEHIIDVTFCAIFNCHGKSMLEAPDLDSIGPSKSLDSVLYETPVEGTPVKASFGENLDFWKLRKAR